MAAIDDVHFGVGHIAFVRVGLRRIERQLVLAPNDQQARLILLHPRLPLRIIFDVGAVVVEKIDLNVALSRPVEKIIFVGVKIGVVAFDVGIVADVGAFVAASESRFSRNAVSYFGRSAQNARRVFQFSPSPVLCATPS